MTWMVRLHPQTRAELAGLPNREQLAIRTAMSKLEQIGPGLPYPHSSAVQGADRLRELRPRAGNSPWRAFYRQLGETFVIAAIGPEAEVKPRGFRKAARTAEQRLAEVEEP